MTDTIVHCRITVHSAVNGCFDLLLGLVQSVQKPQSVTKYYPERHCKQPADSYLQTVGSILGMRACACSYYVKQLIELVW